jgi:predicted transcriptional regulator of viral defense system
MKFFDFEQKIKEYPVFSSGELKTIFFVEKNILVQVAFWLKKGYIKKVKKGLYVLTSMVDKVNLVVLANKIYNPSYLSLEYALNYYGIIPDIPGTYTSVTTRKTENFKNEFGNYSYQKIKEELFVGYKIIQDGNLSYNIAEPEKALMDYLYLNKNKFVADFDFWKELRIDEDFKFDKKEISKYKKLFSNKKVNLLVDNLLNYQKDVR